MLSILPHQLRWIEDNLVKNDVRFVVIGGVAVNYYRPDRKADDVDLLVSNDDETISRLVKSIRQLAQDPLAFQKLHKREHFKVRPPRKIDVLTKATAVAFDEAVRTALLEEMDGTIIPIICRELLISHKTACGDEKDMRDVRLLQG